MTGTGLRTVRILKTLLTLLIVAAAVIGGLFTAAAIAVASIAVLVTRRLFRSPNRPAVGSTPSPVRPRSAAPAGDVIEVTATEVPLTPHGASSDSRSISP